jgi:anti-sigma regulatory factor (Ser/Thr protein kinase)
MQSSVLEVPALLESLEAIGQFVKGIAAGAGLDGSAAYRLRLAVDEIATNIIGYAYSNAALGGTIKVTGQVTKTQAIIVLIDGGQAFDPLANLPAPDELTKPLEVRRIGGLGIFLATTGVDGFSYERVRTRNCNRFAMDRARNLDGDVN